MENKYYIIKNHSARWLGQKYIFLLLLDPRRSILLQRKSGWTCLQFVFILIWSFATILGPMLYYHVVSITCNVSLWKALSHTSIFLNLHLKLLHIAFEMYKKDSSNADHNSQPDIYWLQFQASNLIVGASLTAEKQRERFSPTKLNLVFIYAFVYPWNMIRTDMSAMIRSPGKYCGVDLD